MKKFLSFFSENVLFLFTLFLLFFIPLFPKVPLVDIKNTWVYVRPEDIIVVFVILMWAMLLFRGKITLQTPLTMPILLFWIVGAVATIHGVLLIFPFIANVFPNVAFLSFLRRIEYMSLFFVAYSGMRDKRFLSYVIAVVALTLFAVALYGFGQKYLGFPAYLTMNEEFAKGVPIQLSRLSRVPSTFAGHYDLAAYLVLILPILASLVFGFRKWFIKLALLGLTGLGFILLFMTISRVSFFVLFLSLGIVLLFQKRKLVLISLPVIGIVTLLLFLVFSPRLLERFGSTIREVDVLVDSKTGQDIGQVQEISSERFRGRVIEERSFHNKEDIFAEEKNSLATPAAVLPFKLLPSSVVIVVAQNAPNGESLPQGTGYINLSLSPTVRKVGAFFYEKPKDSQSTSGSERAFVYLGDFLIKRVSAYDLSFTTRFQGEWPRALEAFRRNIFLGSGYGSVSLAVDNDYLRMLGEIGLIGFLSFFGIFVTVGIYIRKILPSVDSPVVKSFVVGYIAGFFGLALNAILIDVFEASKIAYLLWLLTGVVVGILHLYQKEEIHLLRELKSVLVSKYAIITYLFVVTAFVFFPMVSNYFVGDDFTWLRWAADCNVIASLRNACPNTLERIVHYLTQADGFFYRPGTKIYFLLMYPPFWLNQTVYHIVSLVLDFLVVALVFLLSRKILKNFPLAVLATFFFLFLSGYAEIVFWIAATGHLFNVMFILLSLYFFALWKEKPRDRFYVGALLSFSFSLMFHELGIIAPLLMVLYAYTTDQTFTLRKIVKSFHYIFLLFPVLFYLLVRFLAHSHWFNGDYSYNIVKLPFNVIGNAIGYFMLSVFGPISLPFYESLRNYAKGHVLFSLLAVICILLLFVFVYKLLMKITDKEERKIIVFGACFFVISLLPFLGLGNITSRYSYLASFGVVILFAFFIKKLYLYLLNNGRTIAFSSVTVVAMIFFLLHIIQLQVLHDDWYEAGGRTKNFFIAIDNLYQDYWSKEEMNFHFVNVPTRVGDAWIFPVGLPDALWFSFRNTDIHVYQWNFLTDALDATSGSKNEKVFQFSEDGRVTEKFKKPAVDAL